MREIKFRGRDKFGNWRYGLLCRDHEDWYIVEPNEKATTGYVHIRIDPDTVGQFIGIPDKDDNEIYDGDILECNDGGHTYRATIEWHDNGFWIRDETGRLHLPNKEFRRKVGNIHQQ